MALLDADHPDVPALQMMRRVHAVSPRTKLLFLSSRRDYRVVQDFLNGGADGYLLKDDDSRCFVDAVNSVNDGWQYVSPTIRNELVNAVRRVSNPLKRLTEREAEVYRLLVEGMRPKDIATTMGISPKTVDTHRANLMRKLGVQSIASLVRFAMLHEPGISRGRV